MDVVDKPIIATGAAAAGLMNSKLRISVDGCCWEHGHELRVGGLGTATAEGLEHGPSPSGGLVLKLEVLATVGVSPQPERPSCTQAWNGTLAPPARLTTGEVP